MKLTIRNTCGGHPQGWAVYAEDAAFSIAQHLTKERADIIVKAVNEHAALVAVAEAAAKTEAQLDALQEVLKAGAGHNFVAKDALEILTRIRNDIGNRNATLAAVRAGQPAPAAKEDPRDGVLAAVDRLIKADNVLLEAQRQGDPLAINNALINQYETLAALKVVRAVGGSEVAK
jgi:hypothetical protein